MCVARGIAKLHNGEANVMVTNFSNKYKHLNRGTTVAHIDEFLDASNAFMLMVSQGPAMMTTTFEPAVDVNQGLSR